jgi:hypothetical protein
MTAEEKARLQALVEIANRRIRHILTNAPLVLMLTPGKFTLLDGSPADSGPDSGHTVHLESGFRDLGIRYLTDDQVTDLFWTRWSRDGFQSQLDNAERNKQ